MAVESLALENNNMCHANCKLFEKSFFFILSACLSVYVHVDDCGINDETNKNNIMILLSLEMSTALKKRVFSNQMYLICQKFKYK